MTKMAVLENVMDKNTEYYATRVGDLKCLGGGIFCGRKRLAREASFDPKVFYLFVCFRLILTLL